MSYFSLTSFERAYLRSLANALNPIFQYGKDGLSENFLQQIDDALEARELIKVKLLESADCTAKELAEKVCQSVRGCQSVQIIGRTVVFYRRASEEAKRKIVLPKQQNKRP